MRQAQELAQLSQLVQLVQPVQRVQWRLLGLLFQSRRQLVAKLPDANISTVARVRWRLHGLYSPRQCCHYRLLPRDWWQRHYRPSSDAMPPSTAAAGCQTRGAWVVSVLKYFRWLSTIATAVVPTHLHVANASARRHPGFNMLSARVARVASVSSRCVSWQRAAPAVARAHARTIATFRDHYGMWLDGREVDGSSGQTFAVENPATGDVLTHVAEGTADDVNAAVESGQRVFASGEWARADPRDRAAVMNKAAALLAARVPETAELESLQTGRAIRCVGLVGCGSVLVPPGSCPCVQ